MTHNTIKMYRNKNTNRLCIATYIEELDIEALRRIVHEDNIFHSRRDNNQLGMYYTPYTSVLLPVEGNVWIVKYDHCNYAMYLAEDFDDCFELASTTFGTLQEYMKNYTLTNIHIYEELYQDITSIVE